MWASDKAKEAGVEVRGRGADYRTPCPKCSPDRIKKKDPCLHVTVAAGEIKVHCFHCDWGMIFTDDDEPQRHGMAGRPMSGRRDGRPARSVQRKTRWW